MWLTCLKICFHLSFPSMSQKAGCPCGLESSRLPERLQEKVFPSHVRPTPAMIHRDFSTTRSYRQSISFQSTASPAFFFTHLPFTLLRRWNRRGVPPLWHSILQGGDLGNQDYSENHIAKKTVHSFPCFWYQLMLLSYHEPLIYGEQEQCIDSHTSKCQQWKPKVLKSIKWMEF